MTKQKQHTPKVIDTTKVAFTLFGRGIVKGNPRKCIACRKSIKRADTWELAISAPDPQYGRLSVIRHGDCVRWDASQDKLNARKRRKKNN